MKTIKKTIIVLFSIFSSFSICYAQMGYGSPAQELEWHKSAIKNPKIFIFEGHVIKNKLYHGKGQQEWVCSIVQITKIYKGIPVIKLGTIKIIKNVGLYVKSTGAIIPSSDGGEGLRSGDTYIIFGDSTTFEPADTSMLHSVETDNLLTFQTFDQIDLVYKDGNVGALWDITRYNTIDSVYSFFQENGLTIQEQVAPADSTMKK